MITYLIRNIVENDVWIVCRASTVQTAQVLEGSQQILQARFQDSSLTRLARTNRSLSFSPTRSRLAYAPTPRQILLDVPSHRRSLDRGISSTRSRKDDGKSQSRILDECRIAI